MAFLDVEFPARISLQSSGGPVWQTTVVRVDSGHERRNQVWSVGLAQWDPGAFLQDKKDLDEVIAFFHVVAGMANTFRYVDPHDYRVINQSLGPGNGVQATYQIKKSYSFGSSTYTRDVTLPRNNGTLQVTVAGVLKTEGTHYTVSYTTGILTFTAGNIPLSGQTIVIVYGEFTKKARLNSDHLSISYVDLRQGTISLLVLEVR